MAKTQNAHLGSTLDDLLTETGDLADVNALAVKRVIAWEISEKMAKEGLTKKAMAEKMRTSRSSLDRLLDPDNPSVTLHTLDNAAKAVGKTLRISIS